MPADLRPGGEYMLHTSKKKAQHLAQLARTMKPTWNNPTQPEFIIDSRRFRIGETRYTTTSSE
eukprot:5891136-Amphidinium_carterae.2